MSNNAPIQAEEQPHVCIAVVSKYQLPALADNTYTVTCKHQFCVSAL